METKNHFVSDLAIPPGEYLSEVLEELHLSQAELARRIGRPHQAVNEIVKGVKIITPETALQLEKVVGVPAHIWIGLEAEYQLVIAKKEEAESAEKEIKYLEEIPYREMAKNGWVGLTRKPSERVRELQRFFGVSSLSRLEVDSFGPALRQAKPKNASPYALKAWLRKGELLAQKVETADYDEKKLVGAIPSMRSLTQERPEVFFPKLKKIFAECGVAFILLPYISKTNVHGATFWMGAKKAVVLMSIRGKWGDVFWFSLFHELAHVLLHEKKMTFFEGENIDSSLEDKEKEADCFSRDKLIPPDPYAHLIENGAINNRSVEIFAKNIGIAPGLVVGRLQHEKIIPFNMLNGLRVRYEIKKIDGLTTVLTSAN